MKIFHLLFIAILTVCITSCEDKLDKFPLDRMTPSTFFSTEEELNLYSNKFYIDILPEAPDIYQESADAIIITPPSSAVTGQREIPATGGGWNWEALRRVNFLLSNSINCPDVNVRNQYNGLAKFFRAYFYFEKVKRFGDVPWYNQVLGSTDEELYKPRDSRVLVIDSVMKDLDFAIEHLPAEKSLYRITRWTALALKSRVGLFEGTFRKYHGLGDYERLLDASISASDRLMKESGYTAYKTGNTAYRDLFATQTARDQEVILARNYSADLSLFHNVQGYENSSTTGRPGLSKMIVNSYLTSVGTRFTDLPDYATMQFHEETQNRDPRLAQTIRTPGYTRIGGSTLVAPNIAYSLTGYHLIKYTVQTSFDAYNRSTVDIPLFRMGEVYLNYAEAKAERGSLTQSDINLSVKLLRDRISMPNLNMAAANASPDPYLLSSETGYPNVTGPNAGVILEIRRERTVELIMEGFRYDDIMRWKAGKRFEKPFLGVYFPAPGTYDLDRDGKSDVTLYTGTPPATTAPLVLQLGEDIRLSENTKGYIIVHDLIPRQWKENRDYLYPIPIQERSLSNGILTQNPGWEDGL